MKKIILKSCLLFITLAMLMGCRTTQLYDGPQRPPEQVAVLFSGDYTLSSINGKSAGGDTVELLPGRYEIGLKQYKHNYSGAFLSVDHSNCSAILEAGHQYKIVKVDYVLSIVELKSGEIKSCFPSNTY